MVKPGSESSGGGRTTLAGAMSLLLTPFAADGGVDWEAYDRYVDWHLESGATGIFSVCGTSEMKRLQRDERLRLAHRAVARAGDVPVVATANLDSDVRMHEREVREMVDTGVAGIVLVPPDGMLEEPDRFERHIAGLAAVAQAPVLLYEWPGAKPHHIDAGTFGRLVRECGVVGIKDTTCTRAGIREKIEAAPEAVVFQANTPLLLDALRDGARGIMAITSSAAPRLVRRMWEAFDSGSDREAEERHLALVFLDALLRRAHPAAAKYLVGLSGLDMSTRCRTTKPLPEELRRSLAVWHAEYAGR